MKLLYGMLLGAGLLALAQNLFNYRIDQEVIEYTEKADSKLKIIWIKIKALLGFFKKL